MNFQDSPASTIFLISSKILTIEKRYINNVKVKYSLNKLSVAFRLIQTNIKSLFTV